MGGESIKEELKGLGVLLIALVIMIIVGIVYYFVSILIIKGATDMIFEDELNANTGAMAAAIVTAGITLAGALGRR